MICLGAGTITQWAYALPMQLATLDRVARAAAGRRGGVTTALDGEALIGRLPKARGRVEANRSLAEFTWFRAGGPAEVLFTPADEADLAEFLAGSIRRLRSR